VQNLEEPVEALVELGLTHLQAKVYVALLCLETATAKDIHKSSNIARPDVYRMLSELEEKDLVERVISKPTKFRPIPSNDAVAILLRKRNERNHQLQKKAILALSKLQNNGNVAQSLLENPQFILLSKSETNPAAHIDRLGEAVANAQKSVMCLTSFQLFMKAKYRDEQNWKKAVERGVKFKFIISGASENQQIKHSLDPVLRNNENFEIRLNTKPPSACVLLVDDKESFCRIGLTLESPVLLSLSPHYVAMMKDYFETKWKSLEDNQKPQILSK
jgi:sugar-specific transcriptional regulator TrmB